MPLVPRLLRPSVILRRNAIYKGVLGGHKGWLAVGGVLWSKTFLKKTFGRNEEFLASEKLTKGQFLRIDAVRAPTRRQRRKAKRIVARDAREAKLVRTAEASAARQARSARRARKRADERETRELTGAA